MKRLKTRTITILLALVAVTGLGLAGVQFAPRLAYSLFGDHWLRAEPDGLDAGHLAEIRTKTGGLAASVAWSSSRSGNHELYLLRLPEGKVYRLTTNDYVDYFPRFSPGGGALVFARSQEKWVSERDYDRWDAWLLDLASGQERLVAKNANFPLWVDDNQISFMRGALVVVKNLATNAERVVYDGATPPVGGRIETPMLSPNGGRLLALTARGPRRGCLVFDPANPGRVLDFGDGCEIIFSPDGNSVIWMENGGIGGNRVMASPADRVQRRVFMDLPGGFSHEYFPRLSADGRWLVWAASQGDHEHDIADYEIFIWDSRKPVDQAARLTFGKANDRWPDIRLD